MSLMYASRAKNIRNRTHVNTDAIGDSEMQQVVGQVEQLRMKLLERTAEFQRLRGMQSQSTQESKALRAQLARLQRDNDREKHELERCMKEVITNQEGDLAVQRQAYQSLESSVQEHARVVSQQKAQIAKLHSQVQEVGDEAQTCPERSQT